MRKTYIPEVPNYNRNDSNMNASNTGVESFKWLQSQHPFMSGYYWTEDEISTLCEKYGHVPNAVLAEEIGRSESGVKQKAHSLGLTKDQHMKTRWKIRENGVNLPKYSNKDAGYIVGLTDGEGSFNYRQNKKGNLSFRYAVELESGDAQTVEMLQEFFGVGSVYDSKANKEGWSDKKQYTVPSAKELSSVVIPFFIENPPRADLKREQFVDFCEAFIDYYELDGEKLKWVHDLQTVANRRNGDS